MTAPPQGMTLFIVANRVSGWTGLWYLTDWSGITKAFDIATGYYEIGAQSSRHLLRLPGWTSAYTRAGLTLGHLHVIAALVEALKRETSFHQR